MPSKTSKKVSCLTATNLVVANMIGTGVFTSLGFQVASIRSDTALLALWAIGGIVSLFFTGEYLSVPASVGFIALWGIAVLNGVVLVSYIRNLRREGMALREAITEGARLRFRPVMMTAATASSAPAAHLFAECRLLDPHTFDLFRKTCHAQHQQF